MAEESPRSEVSDKENETTRFTTRRVGSVKISRREKLNLENGLISVTQSLKELRETEFTFENVPKTAELLSGKLKECNDLSKLAYESVALKCIGIDSNYFANCSALNCNLVKATDTDYQKFDCSTFADKLITKLNAGGRVDAIVDGSQSRATLSLSDFESLGSNYSNIVNDVPSFQFMFGAFDSEDLRKEVKQRKTRTLKTDGTSKKPETIDAKDVTKHSEDLTAKSVDVLFNDLRKRTKDDSLSYFKFVSDPCSFSKTVENVFHSAFLVKEGLAELSMESGDEPAIRCTKKDQRENRDVNVQAVLSFSMEDWNKWIQSGSQD